MSKIGLVFLIYFFLEVVITIEVGSKLGGFGTFIEMVVSFFIGLFILFNFKYSIKSSLISLATMQIDSKEFVAMNLFSLLGAILLIIPGILSDIIGILMQFGIFGSFVSNFLLGIGIDKFEKVKKKNNKNEEIIDVEIIDNKHNK